jgi:hypothetical protein
MQRDQDHFSQEENLDRVTQKISAAVMEFCRPEREFRMTQLAEFVSARVGLAPDSAGRVLRSLRQSGKIDYEVINRQNSVYRIIRPTPGQERLF